MPRDLPRLEKDIEEYQKFKEEFMAKYGEALSSVWEVKYNKMSLDETFSQQDRAEKEKVRLVEQFGEIDEEFLDTITIGTKSVRGRTAGVSRFPVNICTNLIKFYSELGDTVLDPCAGHNSRMETIFKLGRNYIGYDVSKEYMKWNRMVAEKLLNDGLSKFVKINNPTITLREKSSTWMEEGNESMDFIFTSPPYHNLEYYGDEETQMGWNKTYIQFLENISLMLNECLRVLKVGKYCAININDFKVDGKFFDYHGDVMNIGKQLGFQIQDVIIMTYKRSIKQVFLKEVETRKSLPKNHEFIIVFKKMDKFNDRVFKIRTMCECGAELVHKKISDRQIQYVCNTCGRFSVTSPDFSFIRQKNITE